MKRVLVGGIAASFLLVSIMIGSAWAHTFTASTSLTIAKAPAHPTAPGHDVFIFGSLNSARHACVAHKVVRLMKKRPGIDRLLARDRTDSEGDYSFLRNPTKDQTWYTRFPGSVVTTYGHSHTCLASRSADVHIKIK